MSSHQVRALFGDGNGHYRVLVVGNSGTGKSTLSSALAKKLQIPYISLDRLNWNPGWKERPEHEFRALLQDSLDNSPQGWVVDGNYMRKVGTIVQDRATDIIWLDPPLLLYFPRIFVRTMRGLFRLGEPCSPGCRESLKSVFFSRDSILWCCLSYHRIVRKKYEEWMSRNGLGVGLDGGAGRIRRIGGWGSELKIWWQRVEQLVKERML